MNKTELKQPPQEWTAARIVKFLGLHSKYTEACSFLADAINAAIAAEQDRAELIRTWWKQEIEKRKLLVDAVTALLNATVIDPQLVTNLQDALAKEGK
jgi:hypothetical protein